MDMAHPLLRDSDTQLHAVPIHGGMAVWQEDLSQLNRLRKEILAVQARLEAVNALLPEISLKFAFIGGEQHIYLNGEDVSTAIRTEEVGMAASAVGANPEVRAFLLGMQRDMAKTQDVLMDGRDIGTVVLPDATVKIFLTASPEARATRRWKEYQQKGVEVSYEEVLADVRQRDYQDTHRAAAPLRQADDAQLLDTSEMNFEQSLEAMKKMIVEKVG